MFLTTKDEPLQVIVWVGNIEQQYSCCGCLNQVEFNIQCAKNYLSEEGSIQQDGEQLSKHDQGILFNWIWRVRFSKDVCRQISILSWHHRGLFQVKGTIASTILRVYQLLLN